MIQCSSINSYYSWSYRSAADFIFSLLESLECWCEFAFLSVCSSFSPCLPLACPLSTHACPSQPLSLFLSATHLPEMQTCGSLPGTYCIQSLFFSLPPSLLLFTSEQAGGAPLNRLVVSRGITSRRRGLPGTASRQTVSQESPVSPPSLLTPSFLSN